MTPRPPGARRTRVTTEAHPRCAPGKGHRHAVHRDRPAPRPDPPRRRHRHAQHLGHRYTAPAAAGRRRRPRRLDAGGPAAPGAALPHRVRRGGRPVPAPPGARSGADAYQEFARTARDARAAEIDAAVPGIERREPRTLEPYRSRTAEHDTRAGLRRDRRRAVPRTGPGPPTGPVGRGVRGAGTDPKPASGGIAAHFHVGTDGARAVDHAEWRTARARIDALASAGGGVGAPTPQWRRAQVYPGPSGSDVRRCTPVLGLGPARQHRRRGRSRRTARPWPCTRHAVPSCRYDDGETEAGGNPARSRHCVRGPWGAS